MALIDQDELLKKVKKRKELTEKEADGIPRFAEYYVRLNGVTDGIDRVRQIIEEMPTVEQPKKGHWIVTDKKNVYGGIQIICPFCDDHVMVQSVKDELFCRHCGADMRNGGEHK